MSIFKISWIILKIWNLKENEFLFEIFTFEYWKIKLKFKKNKKEKTLDLWYIIDFEVNIKKELSINEAKNIKIKNEFSYLNKDYETIIEYLELLKIINEKCPLNMPIFEIYNLVFQINELENITNEKLIFAKLKLLNILWILFLENKNQQIQKILSFIAKESIKNILRLNWLNIENKIKLKNLTNI